MFNLLAPPFTKPTNKKWQKILHNTIFVQTKCGIFIEYNLIPFQFSILIEDMQLVHLPRKKLEL